MALNGMLGIKLFERTMFCWLSSKALLPGCYTDGTHLIVCCPTLLAHAATQTVGVFACANLLSMFCCRDTVIS